MAESRRGMGRGLDALFAPRAAAGGGGGPELREVAVELIAPNPRQPRRTFDEDALVALAASIKERGLLQPILLRPLAGGTYELVAGERRWRAAQMAGFERVPALVRAQDDDESLELALIENMAREDLNPVEEARACAVLVDDLGLTREEVGRRVGRSRVAVSNLMRLLDLPDEVLDLLVAGDLTEGHGRALLTAPDHADRRRLARTAALEGWTVRQTEARARETGAGPGTTAPRARRAAVPVHPDQAEAAERLADALARALGAAVEVTPRGEGYRVTLAFDSLDEAQALADRLGALEHA